MAELIIPGRFCGPPQSSNGGYFCGLVAALSPQTLTVRLLKPPPLDTPLEALEQPDGGIIVRKDDVLIAQARVATLTLDPPPPPSYVETLEASLRYAGFREHPFPTCFVCGTARARGDGMRVFAGPVAGRDIVAAPWVPDESLDAGDGKVRPEFMFAAMDCPGCFAANPSGRGTWLLGELTAHIDRLVHIDEPCRVIGWHISSQGRKHEAGTALFDEDGELCGLAKAVWIEPARVTGGASASG
ncbi:MAG TPA: hypothetical protein VFS52_02545 [Steroidobacteraceae bacterium]|jgi:hypothetical protein|nr:hypothetical protein [Steroidobacteraceae bacterium]